MIHDLLASLSPPAVERRPSFDFLLAHTPAQTVKNNPTFFENLKNLYDFKNGYAPKLLPQF